jgi:hypothetical protein
MVDGGFDRIIELDHGGKILGSIGSPGHQPGQLAWGHFLAIGSDGKLIVADVLNWRFQVFVPTKASGKLSEFRRCNCLLFASDGHDCLPGSRRAIRGWAHALLSDPQVQLGDI